MDGFWNLLKENMQEGDVINQSNLVTTVFIRQEADTQMQTDRHTD